MPEYLKVLGFAASQLHELHRDDADRVVRALVALFCAVPDAPQDDEDEDED